MGLLFAKNHMIDCSFQASGYPSVRPGLEGSHAVDLPKGTYGVPDMMLYG